MAGRRRLVTAGESRIGRTVGLIEFWTTMAAVAGLVLWPKVVGAIWAMVTWSDAEKDACTAAPGLRRECRPRRCRARSGGRSPGWP